MRPIETNTTTHTEWDAHAARLAPMTMQYCAWNVNWLDVSGKTIGLPVGRVMKRAVVSGT